MNKQSAKLKPNTLTWRFYVVLAVVVFIYFGLAARAEVGTFSSLVALFSTFSCS